MLAAAASKIQIFDGTTSTTLRADLYAGGDNYEVAQRTFGTRTVAQLSPEFKAVGYQNDVNTTGFSRIYINSSVIDGRDGAFGDNWSTVLHELIRSTTKLTDGEIQTKLGLDLRGSFNFARQLKMDCFDQ